MREDGKGWDYAIEVEEEEGKEEDAPWRQDSEIPRRIIWLWTGTVHTRDGFEYSDAKAGTTKRQARAQGRPAFLRLPYPSPRQHGTALNDY